MAMTPNPVPMTSLAYGVGGSSDASVGNVFTFGTLASGSLATLTTAAQQVLATYYLQVISGTNAVAGNYAILSVNSAAASAAVKTPGMAYKTGDVLSVVGGTSSTPSTWTVTQSGGGVTSLAQSAAGSYTVLPSNPVTFTGGAGTGCQATITWSAPTLGMASTIGANASSVVWLLQQAYSIVPPGFASIMIDNNGYQLDQQGGLTMTAGTLTTSAITTPMCLTSSSTFKSLPCKFVLISPAAHNITIGTSALQSLSYLATAPLFVQIPVSDVSQLWITPATSGDTVGWAAFN